MINISNLNFARLYPGFLTLCTSITYLIIEYRREKSSKKYFENY